jgi:hypothetical protein
VEECEAECLKTRITSLVPMKLYYVDGTRHSAIVLASTPDDAVKLAIGASEGNLDERVLHGHVGDWEGPEAKEIPLPSGYSIVKEQKAK